MNNFAKIFVMQNKYLDRLLFSLVFFWGIYSYFSLKYPSADIKGLKLSIIFIETALLFFSMIYYSKINQIKIIIITCFLYTSDYLLFSYGLVFLYLYYYKVSNYERFKLDKNNIAFYIFLLYAFSLYLINIFFIERSYLAYIFWVLITGTPFIIYLIFTKLSYSYNDIINLLSFIKTLTIIELLLFIIHFSFELVLNSGKVKPGDWGIASLGTADNIGFLMASVLFFINIEHLLFKTRRNLKLIDIFSSITLLFLIILADAKILYLSFATGFFFLIILILFRIFPYYNMISYKKITILILIGLCVIMSINFLFNLYFLTVSNANYTLADMIVTYSTNEIASAKFIFYYVTFVHFYREHFWFWIFGTGPGTFGSRACNALAYDTIFKNEGHLPDVIPPYSTYWTRFYQVDLWTEEKQKKAFMYSSVFIFPYAGIPIIKVELGIIGLLFYLYLFYFVSKRLYYKFVEIQEIKIIKMYITLIVTMLFVPFSMIFQGMNEQPHLMIFIFLLAAILTSYNNKEVSEA